MAAAVDADQQLLTLFPDHQTVLCCKMKEQYCASAPNSSVRSCTTLLTLKHYTLTACCLWSACYLIILRLHKACFLSISCKQMAGAISAGVSKHASFSATGLPACTWTLPLTSVYVSHTGLLFVTDLCIIPQWAMHGDAGIDHGQSLQLEGEGGPAAAKEGVPGNLFVQVSVAPDPVLTRRGTNIHVTVDVDFADAILGGDAK